MSALSPGGCLTPRTEPDAEQTSEVMDVKVPIPSVSRGIAVESATLLVEILTESADVLTNQPYHGGPSTRYQIIMLHT